MPGSLISPRTRPPSPSSTMQRRQSLPGLTPHPLLTLQQRVGNQVVNRLVAPAALPTRTAVEGRLTGGRFFRRSEAQRRILKWVDRWHGGIAAATAGIRLNFLDGLRALVAAYRASKAGEEQTVARQGHVAGLDQLLAEIDAVRRDATRDYRRDDDLPGLGALDDKRLRADLDSLNPTGLTPLGSGGLNATYTAQVNSLGDEMMFKAEKQVDDLYGQHRGTAAGIPKNAPNQTGRAVATYVMAQLMGIGQVVPPTYYSQYGTTVGQVMGLVDGTEGMQMMEVTNFTSAHDADKGLIYWLDLVCGQVDRHAGNFMLVTDGSGLMTGEVRAIDNDLAFGEHYGIDAKGGRSRNTRNNSSLDINGVEARALWITPELAERIIRLSRDAALVRGALNGLLTAGEIDATIARLTSLAAYLGRRLAKRDRIVGWS